MSQPVCPVCNSAGSARKKFRPCAACNQYFHLSCVRLTQRASSAITIWLCPSCLPVGASAPSHISSPQTDTCPELTMKLISSHRRQSKIPARIPKSVRNFAATVLASTIHSAVDSDSNDSWIRLLTFASVGFGVPTAGPSSTSSLATRLRHSLSRFEHSVSAGLLEDLSRTALQSETRRAAAENPSPLDSIQRGVRA